MHLVALYKTFDGHEWIEASLESVYRNVDAVVMVHSDTSWLGERGNTVRERAMAWGAVHDGVGKIRHINVDCNDQQQQYAIGLEYLRSSGTPCDAVLVVDSDEIWDGEYLERAKHQVAQDTSDTPAYRCSMHTYLKTPFYQVVPPYGEPLVIFRVGEGSDWLARRPRGQGCPSRFLENVWMHHFTYVRESFDAVNRKISQSSTADGDRRTPNWKEDVWDSLPFGNALHGCDQWRHVWHEIRRVFRHQIPRVIWESPTMGLFLARGDSLLECEMDALYELSRGKDHAIDLGTLHGNSAAILSLGADVVDTFDLFEDVPRDAVVHVIDGKTTTFADWQTPLEQATRQRLSWYSNVRVNKADVIAAASQFADSSIDLVFVDADHSYECTLGCAVAWLPKLKTGGILLFHDCCAGNPGVQRAVDELRNNLELRPHELPTQWPGSLAAFERVARCGE